MATKERIEQLKAYLKDWVAWSQTAAEQRDKMLDLIELAKTGGNSAMVDVLQKQADAQDVAARKYHECSIYMQSLIDRAMTGEDV
jgi:hypothetical protein